MNLSLSPRYDQWRFQLPKDFLPEEVESKWQEYINKEPGVIITPIDYLNESIKGITFPGINDVLIQQSQHSTNPIIRQNKRGQSLGRINVDPNQENIYVGPQNPLDRIDREFKVTFRLNQGLCNYFMLYESLFYRICKHELYKNGDEFHVDILNEDGIAITRIYLRQCAMSGIDGLDFSFDKVERQSDTFDVMFKFNNIDMDFLDIEDVP